MPSPTKLQVSLCLVLMANGSQSCEQYIVIGLVILHCALNVLFL